MFKKTLFIVVLFLSQFIGLCESASLEEVLSDPKAYDGKRVVIEAEVVGEVLGNGQGEWINILDKGYNIGVFSSLDSEDIFSTIKHWGSYKEKGDTVKVEGVFYKDCPQHQTSAIHVDQLKIVRKGFREKEIVSFDKKRMAMWLFIICLTVNLIYLIKVRHGRKT